MRNILYIFVLILIAGCSFSNKHIKAIDDAQRLMGSDPHAALTKLNAVDVSELEDSSLMARWALLYSEAMLMNNVSAPSDTIINIAIDYYASHENMDECRKASRIKAILRQSDNKDELATALYLQKEKEFFLYKERVKREQFIVLSIIVLIVFAGVIAWLRQRLKLQIANNDALMAEASGLKAVINERSSDINRLQTSLHSMLENRFALIDSLCQTYYETQGSKNERKAIADKVKAEIEALRTESLPKMEEYINHGRNNILVRIKSCLPSMKPTEYQLVVYLAGNLSTRTISLLLGESVDVVYKRKSRLKKRILEADAAENKDFSEIF